MGGKEPEMTGAVVLFSISSIIAVIGAIYLPAMKPYWAYYLHSLGLIWAGVAIAEFLQAMRG